QRLWRHRAPLLPRAPAARAAVPLGAGADEPDPLRHRAVAAVLPAASDSLGERAAPVTDEVLAIVLLLAFLAAMAAVRFFKTLDGGFWRAAGTPIAAGLIAGLAIAYIPLPRFIITGILITLASLYVRLTGEESEPTDG